MLCMPHYEIFVARHVCVSCRYSLLIVVGINVVVCCLFILTARYVYKMFTALFIYCICSFVFRDHRLSILLNRLCIAVYKVIPRTKFHEFTAVYTVYRLW